MTFTVWMGLHGAAAAEFPSARAAIDGVRDLERRGADYLQIVDPQGREVSVDDLTRLAAAEGGIAV